MELGMCGTNFRGRAKEKNSQVVVQETTIRNTLNNNKEKSSGGDEDLASDEGAAKGTSMLTLSREIILVNGGMR
jgi:hypothetical protein